MNTNDRSIVGLVTVAHAMVHTYELSIPVFMTVWLADLGLSTSALGLAATVGYALFGLGALPSGILVDRLGSRRLIAVCLAGMGGAFVLLSIAHTVWTITLALMAWGVAASIYHPAGLSLVSTGTVQRGKAFALHGMAGNVGIALGPLATALLLIVLDWTVVAAVLAVPAALAAVYALRASFDEHAGEKLKGDGVDTAPAQTLSELWHASRGLFATGFAAVFAIVMLSGLYYRGALTFLPDLLTPLVTIDLPVDWEAGRYVYAGLLMVGIGGQYVGGRLTDRFPTERSMAVVLALLAVIALAFLPVAQLGTAALLGISAVFGFALFAVQPLYQATVAEVTPVHARGLSYGYTYLGVFGVGALGAAVAGTVLQVFSPTVLFVVLATFAGTAATLSTWLATRSASSEKVASPS
ncbi:MAG: MFS transporter [Bacteroidetes bacterium]|jgi:MFS family permease|nr:MFS transporter [Bacteroidota bacterium]